MKRLLHWGPIIALLIIKCISLTTLYFTGLWLNIRYNIWLSLINYTLYYGLLASTLYNFFCAIIIGPDYVPKGWRPESNDDDVKYLQYCHQCDGYKAPRSHHCSKCKRCILKMDHHCPWINNCCGYRNQKYFFNFLLSAVIGSLQSSLLLSITLYRALTFTPNIDRHYIHLTIRDAFLILISIGMAIGVVFAVGFLLYLQTKIIIWNRTSIEDWIIKKAENRKRQEPFIFPYDLGVWKNIRQVLFEPLSDGIRWPIRNDCHQYTLTYEQIQQKKDKIDNASIYRIVRPYNGRYFPLFTQGFKVCITFPINDDNRLAVETGDEILVTHCHKYWFYGQKFVLKNDEKIRQKGWFPCQCAVLMVQPALHYQTISDTTNNHGGDDLLNGNDSTDKKDQ